MGPVLTYTAFSPVADPTALAEADGLGETAAVEADVCDAPGDGPVPGPDPRIAKSQTTAETTTMATTTIAVRGTLDLC
jgi:hypothetical protein